MLSFISKGAVTSRLLSYWGPVVKETINPELPVRISHTVEMLTNYMSCSINATGDLINQMIPAISNSAAVAISNSAAVAISDNAAVTIRDNATTAIRDSVSSLDGGVSAFGVGASLFGISIVGAGAYYVNKKFRMNSSKEDKQVASPAVENAPAVASAPAIASVPSLREDLAKTMEHLNYTQAYKDLILNLKGEALEAVNKYSESAFKVLPKFIPEKSKKLTTFSQFVDMSDIAKAKELDTILAKIQIKQQESKKSKLKA